MSGGSLSHYNLLFFLSRIVTNCKLVFNLDVRLQDDFAPLNIGFVTESEYSAFINYDNLNI